MYTRDSPIAAPSDVTADELAAAWMAAGAPESERANVKRAATAAVRYSDETGIDPLLMGAVGWIETGEKGTGRPFRSTWWRDGFNFGNLGITGDDDQNAAAQTWDTPYDGAAAAVAHMVAYRYGDDWRDYWNDEFEAPAVLDKRFELAIANTPKRKGVKTFGELNRRWAIDADDDYGGKLAQRANALRATITKIRANNGGSEPMPTRDPLDLIRDFLVDAWVDKDHEGQGFNYGNRTIVGLAEHETQGEGSAEWYEGFFECPNGERCEDALVDYLIPQRLRKIYRFQNPYTSNRIPHASGGSAASITQLARKASARMGNPFGGVNAFYAAVEIVKRRGAAMDAGQIEMTARLLAYTWAMREYKPEDVMFPDEFGNDVKTSVNHSDLYTSTNCRINDGDRNAFEALAMELYADWYAGGDVDTPTPTPTPVPTYAAAVKVAALDPYMNAKADTVPAVILAEGSEWIYVNDRVTVVQDTPRLQRARPDALPIGPPVKKGEAFTAKFMVKASAGDWYYLTAYYTRIQMRHTARLSDTV